MTYIDQSARAPVRRTIPSALLKGAEAPETDLIIRGQGTIAFALARPGPFRLTIRGEDPGVPSLRWNVVAGDVSLDRSLPLPDGGWEPLDLVVNEKHVKPAGIDPSPDCAYWFSFDCHNRTAYYGKGEIRLGTMIASHQFPKPDKEKKEPDISRWLTDLQHFEISIPTRDIDIWRDPVTVDPPMRVVRHDAITMDDIAAGKLTVPASLTPVCQKLYDNVAGASFILDTPDFPLFSAAIKASIEDKEGWCYKVLDAKAREFGEYDPLKTYLRITLGANQGESPGIPFVMEIWPGGHYSPIHNHGGANAVIRVLHGEITVSLFPMLSPDHVTPFAVETFVKEEVTWISERLNQVHKLINLTPEPCITIQCYLYDEDNRTHWPYFDYLENGAVGHFDPDSDADFLWFKNKMKEEWAKRIKPMPGN
jgi:hypothetical protein